MLTDDRNDLAHVSIHSKERLVFITKIVSYHHSLTIGIRDVARHFAEQSPVCGYHSASPSGKDGRAFLRINVYTGMHDIRSEEHASITIFGKGPVDIIRCDGTGKVKMI